MEIVDTPYIIKERHLNSYPPVQVKYSAVELVFDLFGVSERSIKSKTEKLKYNIQRI